MPTGILRDFKERCKVHLIGIFNLKTFGFCDKILELLLYESSDIFVFIIWPGVKIRHFLKLFLRDTSQLLLTELKLNCRQRFDFREMTSPLMFIHNKSAASTAPCPATALTSNNCRNAVKNEIKGRALVFL